MSHYWDNPQLLPPSGTKYSELPQELRQEMQKDINLNSTFLFKTLLGCTGCNLAQGASVGPESARRLDGCPAFNAIIEDSEIEYFRDYPKVANDHEVLSALEGICKVTREKNQPDVISCAKKDILSIIEKLEPTTKISLLRNMANEIEKEN